MPCPCCYGLSAQDDGSRLTLERYVQVMHQIASGGVPKIIFGGYAANLRLMGEMLLGNS
jgi:hypothetical protein